MSRKKNPTTYYLACDPHRFMSLEKWHQVASWGSDSILVAINDAMEELGYGKPIASGNTGHGGWGAPLLSDSPLVHIVAGHCLTSGSGYWCVVGFTEDTKFGVEAPYVNGGALIRDIATHQVNLAVVFTVDGRASVLLPAGVQPQRLFACHARKSGYKFKKILADKGKKMSVIEKTILIEVFRSFLPTTVRLAQVFLYDTKEKS